MLLALLAALLGGHLRAPQPWMLGPLLAVAVAVAGVSGVRVEVPAPFRNAGQCVMGTALGLYFTLAMLAADRCLASDAAGLMLPAAWSQPTDVRHSQAGTRG